MAVQIGLMAEGMMAIICASLIVAEYGLTLRY
jgi:hypothetical protein